MRQAKDLMTANPKFIQSGWEVRDAVQFFLENEIHFAPVITPMNEILGMASELGLIKASLRQYMVPEKHDKVIHHQEILEEVVFVNEEQTLEDVVKCMIRAPSNRVLVQGKHNKVVGIISPRDILRFMTGEQKKAVSLRQAFEDTKKKAEEMAMELNALKTKLDRFQSLYNETPHMMHSVNAEGKIVLANKRIHQVLGYKDGELIGKSITDLYPDSVHHEAVQGLQRIMRDGFHASTYTSMLSKTGEKIRVDIVSSALKDKDGRFIATITISRAVDSENLLRALHGLISKDPDLAALVSDSEEALAAGALKKAD